MSLSSMGEKNASWKGDNVGLCALHKWLRNTFGKANQCESPGCSGVSTYYNWAKIKGKEYLRRRDNFMMLCRSCHTKYDMTEEWANKIAETHRKLS